MLTSVQAKALTFIIRFQRETGGVSPTLLEITKALGNTNKSNAHRLVEALEERGFIHRIKHRHQAIFILKDVRGQPVPQTVVRALEGKLVGDFPSRIPIYRSGDNRLMGFLPEERVHG